MRMLFADYSSAFSTIVPSKLVSKLKDLNLKVTMVSSVTGSLTFGQVDSRLYG